MSKQPNLDQKFDAKPAKNNQNLSKNVSKFENDCNESGHFKCHIEHLNLGLSWAAKFV